MRLPTAGWETPQPEARPCLRSRLGERQALTQLAGCQFFLPLPLHAYIRSEVARDDARANRVSGLLLHPSVGVEVDECVETEGHTFRFVPSIWLGRRRKSESAS